MRRNGSLFSSFSAHSGIGSYCLCGEHPINIEAHRANAGIKGRRHMRPLMIGNSSVDPCRIVLFIRDYKGHIMVALHGKMVWVQSRTVISAPENDISISLRSDPSCNGQRIDQRISRPIWNLDTGPIRIVRIERKGLSDNTFDVGAVE